jgi:DNA-directed RNA polymerase subunit E'/Rpb7
MTETQILKKSIVLDNAMLAPNIESSILEKLKQVVENDCSKDFGYILKVIKLVKILDNYISNVNSELIFIVQFEAETIKPEVGKVYTDTICMVLSGGIFLKIKGKFMVLIPPSVLQDYEFQAEKKIYVSKVDSTVSLKTGDVCNVKISGVRYLNKNYDCFGCIA